MPIFEASPAAPIALSMPSPLAEHLPLLLWDVDRSTLDPQAMYKLVIQRVIERGTQQDWAGMLAYYGKELVRELVLTTPYLSDAGIVTACEYFNIEKESLRCYQRKLSNPVPFSY